jgi:hypothetical protein
VDINVKSGTITATPGKTSTPVTAGPDRATYIADLSIPDGTTFGPSLSFKKTWRIKNTGTTTWGAGYKLVFVSGNQMSGPAEAPLASTVAPNGIIDISVDLISPASNGSYRGYWQLKNAAGALFGIGDTADKPFWVDIKVSGGSTGPTATATVKPATATITATTGAAAATPTVTATKPAVTPTLTITPTVTGTIIP